MRAKNFLFEGYYVNEVCCKGDKLLEIKDTIPIFIQFFEEIIH